jgi:hypothetical protein
VDALFRLPQSHIAKLEDEMRKILSVVLAMALCTGWSTAQAANRIQLSEHAAEQLIELLTAASKESHTTPPPKTLFKKANEGFGFVTDTVGRVAILAGTSVGICTWYHWYEWCDQTAHNNDHRPHDHE